MCLNFVFLFSRRNVEKEHWTLSDVNVGGCFN